MLREFPDIVIEGARQVGKSMLARQLVPTARAVNLDEVATRDAARADPALLLGYEGSIIIDEIQHVPELTLAVRANIDENRHPG